MITSPSDISDPHRPGHVLGFQFSLPFAHDLPACTSVPILEEELICSFAQLQVSPGRRTRTPSTCTSALPLSELLLTSMCCSLIQFYSDHQISCLHVRLSGKQRRTPGEKPLANRPLCHQLTGFTGKSRRFRTSGVAPMLARKEFSLSWLCPPDIYRPCWLLDYKAGGQGAQSDCPSSNNCLKSLCN